MTVTYRFVIDHLDDPARKTEAQTFAQAFSEYRDGGTWFFLIPSKQVATAAQALLRTLSVQWQMVYLLRLDADDLDAYPAFFPGIPAYYGLIDANTVVEKKLRKNTIVKDLESGRIIVSREWKQLCEPRCSGLSFDAVSGDRGHDFFFLDVNTRLPEPIGIVAASRIAPGGEGHFAVVSDGLYGISDDNVATLNEVGIAMYDSVEYEHEIYPVSPQMVVSQSIATLFVEHAVRNATDMIVVLPRSHPLLHD